MKKIIKFYPSLAESWMLLGLFFGSTLLAAIPMALFTLLAPSAGSWAFFLSYLISFFLLAAFVLAYLKIYPEKILEAQGNPVQKINISLFFLLLVMTPCLSILLEPLMSWWPMPELFENMMEKAVNTDFPSFLSVVIAAPILEEYLFRGLILKGLLKHTTPFKAIAWSALMFAVMHLNPWQAVPAFGLGLFFGWVYWRTRSLWPCIFMHLVNNGMAYLMLYLYPEAKETSDIFDGGMTYIPLLALAIFVLAGYLLYRKIGKEKALL